MSVTDAVESKSLGKQNDASHTLVSEAYDPKTLKGTPSLGPSPDSHTTSQPLSNGQLDFGDVASLYGSQGTHTGSVGRSEATAPEGKLGPTPTAKESTAEAKAKEVKVDATKKAVAAVNPNPQGQIDKVQRQPQPVDPTDIGLPTASATGVDQTTIGDCYFESALASLANSPNGPTALQNMIKTNSDGSYTVTFPGDTSNPVNVTQADLTNAASSKDNGEVADTAKWARIAQTAFLKYDNLGTYGTGPDAQQHKVVDSDGALHLLTGETASTDSLASHNQDTEVTSGKVSNADVARSLTEALANGDPVTASTGTSSNDRGALEGNHVFSVLSYDAKTDKVVVRNPWGNNGSNVKTDPLAQVGATVDGVTSLPDGRLEMSLETFTSRFSDVNFANQNPVNTDLQNVATDMAPIVPNGMQAVSDLFQGNTAGVNRDLSNVGNAGQQVYSDGLYSATSASYQAASLFNAVESAGAQMASKAYQDVTSFV